MIKIVTPIKPNQCPICGGILKIVEVERTTYSLNEYGRKESYLQEDFYDAFLQCTKCGNKLDVEKHGNYFCPKKVLPEVKFEIHDYNPFQINK